jgi:dTDP-4-dehydrorhamnose 3,5-epimerase
VTVIDVTISDAKSSPLKKHGDGRGFFCESFKKEDHPGIEFVQDNLSMSAASGTVRGLHFQRPPFAQTKLVIVLRGAVFDVAVDLRRGTPLSALDSPFVYSPNAAS